MNCNKSPCISSFLSIFKMLADVVNLFIGLPLKIFNVFGACPLQINLSLKEKLSYWTSMVLFHIFEYGFLIFQLIYILSNLGDMHEVADCSNFLFAHIPQCTKFSLFAWHRKDFINLLQLMTQDLFVPQNETHVNRLKKKGRIINHLCLFFMGSACTTTTLWILIALFNSQRSFPFKIWMPISPDQTPQYALGFLIQATIIYTAVPFYAIVDQVPLAMVMFSCAQLEIIGDKLKEIKSADHLKPGEKKEYQKRNNHILEECVKQHQAVLRFLKITEGSYNIGMFIQLVNSVAAFCMIGLRAMLVDKTTMQFYSMVTYMNTMLAQLFLYCWCGQKLTEKAKELRKTLYECPWYDQDMRFRRTLWITMERLARPAFFRAGKYIELSHPLFVQILRKSYSFFVVLYRTSQGE